MNSEIKTKWLAALRGGKYKQGQQVLHNTDDNTYCCLGVLCEVMGLRKIPRPIVIDNEKGISVNGVDYVHETSEEVLSKNERVLPSSLASMLGNEGQNPMVEYVVGETRRSLAELNDHGWSFEQIADIIEKQL